LNKRREPASGREITHNVMRRQPFTQRLFGWMFVWRSGGWLRSWRWWPHWARLAAEGSPRYWVYSAAASLFSQLPDVLEVDGDRAMPLGLCEKVVRSLPVVRGRGWADTSVSWANLVGEVGWNYHRFLET